MKKLLTVLAGVTALAGVVATVAGAAVVTRSTVHSEFTFLDACSGEPVFVSGDVDFLTTSTVNDNNISGTFRSLFKATGTGLTSGLRYQEIVTFNREFHTSLQNGEANMTMEGLINVVAPGPGNNLFSPIFAHTTINANGEVTSAVFDFPPPMCH